MYNLAFLFDGDVKEALIAWSRRLAAQGPTDYRLGAGSLPHVTLLQFDGEERELAALWKALQAVFPEGARVAFEGLRLVPDKTGATWIEVAVMHTRSLEAMQRRALEIIGERPLHNTVGELYRPHATLVRMTSLELRLHAVLEPDLLLRQRVSVRPALGRSGPRYQFARVLFRHRGPGV